MTHPNVTYWTARAELSASNNLEVAEKLTQIIVNTNDSSLVEALQLAMSRLNNTQHLAESLVKAVQHYEERIALLK